MCSGASRWRRPYNPQPQRHLLSRTKKKKKNTSDNPQIAGREIRSKAEAKTPPAKTEEGRFGMTHHKSPLGGAVSIVLTSGCTLACLVPLSAFPHPLRR